jgi:hypothetical protein
MSRQFSNACEEGADYLFCTLFQTPLFCGVGQKLPLPFEGNFYASCSVALPLLGNIRCQRVLSQAAFFLAPLTAD